MYTHLTNYSINKNNGKYNAAKISGEQVPHGNDSDEHDGAAPVEHKRSYKEVLRLLEEQGH